MPAEPPSRDEQRRPTAGRPTSVRRSPATPGSGREVPRDGVSPAEQEPLARPQALDREAWSSTTYGRPVRRTGRRPNLREGEAPAAQAPGREQRLAELNRPAPHDRAPRPPAPPTPGAAPRRPGAPRRRRRVLAVLALVVVLLLAYPLALGWRGWSAVSRVEAIPGGERPAATPGTTYLIVGSDSRDGLTPEEIAEYSAGGDDISGRRTDTIMLLHVPASGGPSVLISVPRDSYVPIPGHDSNKINAAFSLGGAPLLVQTVEAVSGLRVDHYVETGFGGFAQIVNAVGGVEMCPEVAVDDVRAGLDIQAGCQRMDGKTALGYARYRYTDPLGDFGRANRQRQLLAAIVSKAASPSTLLNPFTAFPLASAGGAAVSIDDDSSPASLVTFAQGMRGATGADGISMTVPVSDPALPTKHGTAVKWNTDEALQMFADLKSDDTEALRTLVAPA